jgi:hypothetical protein
VLGFEMKTFCFAVSPLFSYASTVRPNLQQAFDGILNRNLCYSASSLAFLLLSGFDFQHALQDGVPLLSRWECEKLREQLSFKGTEENLFVDEKGQRANVSGRSQRIQTGRVQLVSDSPNKRARRMGIQCAHRD